VFYVGKIAVGVGKIAVGFKEDTKLSLSNKTTSRPKAL
jgi:hypothetical protein